ncbi:MAG: hypothetical protein LBL58_10920 [Tannerellaceae bacterium]|jgi:hypothetical protein|nr:hypothetical protein [Tannerellaceae bacterium]
MRKIKISAFLLGLSCIIISCESNYRVGTSTISIEPTDETISLTLAGYAAPYPGRFSLTWDDMGLFGKMNSLAAVDEDFFALNQEGDLLCISNTDFSSPNVLEPSTSIKHITGFNHLLYGITNAGKIQVYNPQSTKPEWETVCDVKSITALTSSDKYLYVTTTDGELLSGTVLEDKIVWSSIGEAENILSIACDGDRIYALANDYVLYQSELKNNQIKWVRIGYNNGDSYTLELRQIVHYKNKLFALANDNHIYRSKHNTEGKLSVRAMSIGKGKETVILVGVDVCGFDYSFTNNIKEEIYQRRGIPPEAILINTSHSHYTPVTQSWITWEEQHQHPDTLFLTNVVRKGIIRAIEESLDNMVASDLSFARDTTDIGRNRSLKEEFYIYDNSVDVLQADVKESLDKHILFLTGCHPVYTDPDAGNYMISPNYPGYAREWIEEETGSSNSLFLQACAGDINPKDPFKVSGKKLAESVLRALSGSSIPIKGDISYYLDTIRIPISPWAEPEIVSLKDSVEKNLEDAVNRRDYRWANLMLNHYKNASLPHEMPIYVQTINIGNWKLIGLSREVTTEFGLAIKMLYKNQPVSVIAYTNDVASYLATDPHIHAKDYEGYGSFFWYGQPACFPLKTLDTVVNKIKENNR